MPDDEPGRDPSLGSLDEEVQDLIVRVKDVETRLNNLDDTLSEIIEDFDQRLSGLESGPQHVRQMEAGGVVRLTMTRGTGTRDAEEWRIVGRGETADGALDEFDQGLRSVVGDPGEGPLAEAVRRFQPGEDVGDDDG